MRNGIRKVEKRSYFRPSPTLLSLRRSNKKQVPSFLKQTPSLVKQVPTFFSRLAKVVFGVTCEVSESLE